MKIMLFSVELREEKKYFNNLKLKQKQKQKI
jgi:hypothetical protein